MDVENLACLVVALINHVFLIEKKWYQCKKMVINTAVLGWATF